MSKWPNFFIVGAPKAGTTSLYEHLKNIPEIYMSSIKEPNYFSITIVPENYPDKPIRDQKKYLNLFDNAKNEILRGEASTRYLEDPQAAKLIHQNVPDALILISLRDPVERAFSHYNMLVKRGWVKCSIHEDLQKEIKNPRDFNIPHFRLENGLYAEQVQRYFDIFGRKQVKIIIFEEFIKNPKKTVEEILGFLELNPIIYNFDGSVHNKLVIEVPRGTMAQYFLKNNNAKKIARKLIPSFGRKFLENKILKREIKPKLEPRDRDILINYYQDDVKKLEVILGRKLPWKNFKFKDQ